MFPVFPLHQCLQRAVMNEPKQLSISNQHIWVPRLCVFNFAQFDVCLECEVTVLSKLISKKRVCKSIDIQKKKAVHHMDSNPRPECKSVALPIGCGFWWNVARVFSTASSSTCCRTQSDHHIHSRGQTWSRRMMGLWCSAVDKSLKTDPGELSAWQTDRRTAFQLYIYITYIDNCLVPNE